MKRVDKAALSREHRKLRDQLEFQVRHDALTGLLHRTHFVDLLGVALREAPRRSGGVAVFFINLDRFNHINDTLDHAAGDRVLAETGTRLKRWLTGADRAGRVGGDEFAVLITGPSAERSALETAHGLRNVLAAPHCSGGQELFVTASIGIATFAGGRATAADLLRQADIAMHQAKRAGGNRIEMYLEERHSSSLERLRLESDLRRALDHGELGLLFHPLVDMKGHVDALEALLTWRHPVYGTVSPQRFIPIAEETGFIVEIGSWVLLQACLQGARWRKAGLRPVRIAVNVSALQLERRDFVDTVAAALETSGLPARFLQLELTESCVMRDFHNSAGRMSEIVDLGVSIAIDDFGTGYSSLSYLNRLPVDSLKIDQSFLRAMLEPDGSLPVIQSIVRLAHGLHLAVVAEGVETTQQLELVRLLGCDKTQGHLYGPPLPAEEIEALLTSSSFAVT